MLRQIVLFAASSFAGIVLGNIHVPAAPEMSYRIVPYGDLNLSTANGSRVMLDRIRLAAREVCRPKAEDLSSIFRSGEGVMKAHACVSRTIDDAVAQLGNPTADALFGSHQLVWVSRSDRPGV
jgi:UrcA family protein